MALLLATCLPVAMASLAYDKDMSLRERPVQKVVRMLQDMKVELTNEMEDDKAVQETLECWCKTGKQDKEKAIEEGVQRKQQLEDQIGSAVAKVKELTAKRKATWDEIQKDHAALQEAETMRMKENKEFHAEEVDLIEATKACQQATVALSKQNPDLMEIRSVAHMLQDKRIPTLAMSRSSKSQMNVLKNFLTDVQQSTSFLSIPGMQSYAPQSGQIFGVLKQMKENFEEDLASAQKDEEKAVAEFQSLKAAKEEELEAGNKAIEQFDADIADLKEENAQAFKELAKVEQQLEWDREFLATLEEKCAATDEAFQTRMKARIEEIAAVDDTIKILNSDQAFANFDKSVNSAGGVGSEASFLQTSSSSKVEAVQREKAASLLQKAAGKTSSMALALVAMHVQLDAFTKVKAEIDKMVTELSQQQKDEVAHRDDCISSFHENKREEQANYDKKENLEAKIADTQASIKQLTEDIEAANNEIKATLTSMDRASSTREAQNAAYLQTVQDQRLTQIILSKALARMKEVYAFLQGPGAPHIQTSATHTDPGNGPAKFKEYEQNAGGSKVVAMIEEVITDSKKTEDDAHNDENESQQTYENMMKSSNKNIVALQESVVSMESSRASDKSSLELAKSDLGETVNTLEDLNEVKGDLHKSCDYITKNFDARQAARAAEIEALGEAKAILSGMN